MKLPWNKKYLVIAFHVVITLLAVYALKYGIDFLAYVFKNLGNIGIKIQGGISWFLSQIIVIVIAFIIAYLLDPVVEFLQNRYDILCNKHKINIQKSKLNIFGREQKPKKSKEKDRLAGTLITYFLILFIITLVTLLLVNSINKNGSGNPLDNIILSIKNSVSGFQEDLSNFYDKVEGFFIKNNIFDEYISPQINRVVRGFTQFIYELSNNAISLITSLGSGILNFAIGLVICFYFLKDKMVIKTKIENAGQIFLPKKLHNFLKDGFSDIHAVFSGYIRGMLLDACIMAILISVTLSIIGLKFAVIIGFISGFSNVIPYFGALVAFVLAISVAFISGEPLQALYATIAILALQQVDTIFISPKVIGQNVELSPVLVIIALSIAGNLFGIWGMVFAVPVFATIKIFMGRIYSRQKRKKDLDKALENL